MYIAFNISYIRQGICCELLRSPSIWPPSRRLKPWLVTNLKLSWRILPTPFTDFFYIPYLFFILVHWLHHVECSSHVRPLTLCNCFDQRGYYFIVGIFIYIYSIYVYINIHIFYCTVHALNAFEGCSWIFNRNGMHPYEKKLLCCTGIESFYWKLCGCRIPLPVLDTSRGGLFFILHNVSGDTTLCRKLSNQAQEGKGNIFQFLLANQVPWKPLAPTCLTIEELATWRKCTHFPLIKTKLKLGTRLLWMDKDLRLDYLQKCSKSKAETEPEQLRRESVWLHVGRCSDSTYGYSSSCSSTRLELIPSNLDFASSRRPKMRGCPLSASNLFWAWQQPTRRMSNTCQAGKRTHTHTRALRHAGALAINPSIYFHFKSRLRDGKSCFWSRSHNFVTLFRQRS